MSENRQALNKVVRSLANLDVTVRQYYTSIRKRGVSSWTTCTIIFTFTFYYSGNKSRTLWQANSYMEHVEFTVEYALTGTPFTISHYQKKFQRFPIRSRESFTTVFKITAYDPKGEIRKLYQTLTCYYSFG